MGVNCISNFLVVFGRGTGNSYGRFYDRFSLLIAGWQSVIIVSFLSFVVEGCDVGGGDAQGILRFIADWCGLVLLS